MAVSAPSLQARKRDDTKKISLPLVHAIDRGVDGLIHYLSGVQNARNSFKSGREVAKPVGTPHAPHFLPPVKQPQSVSTPFQQNLPPTDLVNAFHIVKPELAPRPASKPLRLSQTPLTAPLESSIVPSVSPARAASSTLTDSGPIKSDKRRRPLNLKIVDPIAASAFLSPYSPLESRVQRRAARSYFLSRFFLSRLLTSAKFVRLAAVERKETRRSLIYAINAVRKHLGFRFSLKKAPPPSVFCFGVGHASSLPDGVCRVHESRSSRRR